MFPSRRKGTDKVVDPKKCNTTFSKRSDGLTKKADALYSLTGALVAVIAVPPKGKSRFFGSPSLKGVISKLLWPTSPKEGVDRAKKECDSCATKEDCASLFMKYLNTVIHLLKKLKNFENNPSVNAGAGHKSGVGAGREPSLSAFPLSLRNSSIMHTGSSSSLSLPEKTKKRPSPSSPSPSTPKMVGTRRKGTDKIDDPKKCNVTFSKRRDGLMKKADALHSLTGAYVAVIVVSPKGEFHFFSSPSTEGVISKLLPSKSPKEGVDWAKKERDSCATKEDCTSLIMKYLAVLVRLKKKLEDFKKNPSVNAGAGHESGVGAGSDPSFVAFTEDGVDRDIFLTSPADSAATSSESSGMDFNLTCSHLETVESLLANLTELAEDNDIRTFLWESNPEGNENNADDIIFAGLQSLGVSL